MKIYSGLNYEPRLLEDIKIIRETAKDYVGLLESKLLGDPLNPLSGEYQDMLLVIQSCYPYAYNFIEGMQ